MNRNLDFQPREQLVRDQCRVGDWVIALHVPEWRDAMDDQVFRPESSIVISPQLGQYGGTVPADHPGRWRFAPEHREGKAVWVRGE